MSLSCGTVTKVLKAEETGNWTELENDKWRHANEEDKQRQTMVQQVGQEHGLLAADPRACARSGWCRNHGDVNKKEEEAV